MKRRTGTLLAKGRGWECRVMIDGKITRRMMRNADGELITKRREAEAAQKDFAAELGLGVKDEAKFLETVYNRMTKATEEAKQIDDAQAEDVTTLKAWCLFKNTPKGRTPRGRVIMPGARTIADYEGHWHGFCKWMDDTYPKKDKDGNKVPWSLRQITKEHAQKYIDHVGANRSANTRNKTVTLLRLIFKVLTETAKLQSNPFEGIDAAPAAVNRKRPLTLAELAAVSKKLEGKGEMETLFSIGYYTGARLGDCVLMRWSSIDMGARKIRYTPHKTAKGNREITLTLAPALHSLLEGTPKKERKGLVLPELGELYQKDPAAVSKRVQKVFEDADIETALKITGYKKRVATVGFHSLRHAHITALLEGGVPMDMVRQQAGHSTIGMTAHYYHASEKALKAATDALPAMGQGNAQPEGADAAGAKLATVLDILNGLADSEIATVAKAVQEITAQRQKV